MKGELPEGWREVRVGDVAKVITGNTPTTKNDENYGNYVPFVKPPDLNDCEISEAIDSLSEEGARLGRVLPPNSILVSCIGTLGKTGINTIPVAFNQQINAIRFSELVDPRYGFYYCQTLKKWLNTVASTTTLPIVNKSKFKSAPFILPPLPEQRAIARALRSLQEAKEARTKEVALERERKRALMAHLFSYGPNSEAIPIKKIEFGEVPKHWRVMPLKKCAYVQTGVAKGRKLGDEPTFTLPYLRVANVQDGYLNLSEIKQIELRESEIERYSLRENDVLLTEGGDFDKLGRGFIWKGQIPNCVHQNHIFAVRANCEVILPEYLAYLIQSDYGKRYFLNVAHQTTHLACINSSKLKAFPILLPDQNEQKCIVDILAASDAKIEALDSEIRHLEELFSALLEELMSGRISAKSLIEPELGQK